MGLGADLGVITLGGDYGLSDISRVRSSADSAQSYKRGWVGMQAIRRTCRCGKRRLRRRCSCLVSRADHS